MILDKRVKSQGVSKEEHDLVIGSFYEVNL